MCFICNKKVKRIIQLYNRLTVCHSCFKKYNGFRCVGCGLFFLSDKIIKNKLCNHCIKASKNQKMFLHNYFFKPYPTFYKVGDEENLYFGIQLQIGGTKKQNVNIFSVNNEDDFFYIKHDSTIPKYGCEIVTYPATLQYHKSDLNNWKKLLNNAFKLGFKCLQNCGLHIHINRNYFNSQQIAMIDYFVNNNQKFFKQLSNRQSQYAKFLKKPFFLYGYPINYKRHCALNLLNQNTIQFRTFNSSIDYQYIIQKIQFLYCLSHYVKTFDMLQDFVRKQNPKDVLALKNSLFPK